MKGTFSQASKNTLIFPQKQGRVLFQIPPVADERPQQFSSSAFRISPSDPWNKSKINPGTFLGWVCFAEQSPWEGREGSLSLEEGMCHGQPKADVHGCVSLFSWLGWDQESLPRLLQAWVPTWCSQIIQQVLMTYKSTGLWIYGSRGSASEGHSGDGDGSVSFISCFHGGVNGNGWSRPRFEGSQRKELLRFTREGNGII